MMISRHCMRIAQMFQSVTGGATVSSGPRCSLAGMGPVDPDRTQCRCSTRGTAIRWRSPLRGAAFIRRCDAHERHVFVLHLELNVDAVILAGVRRAQVRQ